MINTIISSKFFWAFVSFLIGVIFSCAELLSRYKSFSMIVKNANSVIYLFINGMASFFGFLLLVHTELIRTNLQMKALISGGSAMLVLRSSFANIIIGDKNVRIGLTEVIQVFLNYCESSFDLARSKKDVEQINPIMENISFEKAKTALPYTCFNLMKSISDDSKRAVSDAIIELSKSNHSQKTKAINLGIILSNVTKFEFLKVAIKVLGDDIKNDSSPSDMNKKLVEMDELLEKLK